MKSASLIATACVVAIVALGLSSCATTYTKTTSAKGVITEQTVKAYDAGMTPLVQQALSIFGSKPVKPPKAPKAARQPSTPRPRFK